MIAIRNHTTKFVLLLILITLKESSCGQIAQNKTPKTGVYDDFVSIAYDSITGKVSGFISYYEANDNEKGNKFSCYILFTSGPNIRNFDTIPIVFYHPQNQNQIAFGSLQFKDNDLRIRSFQVVPFCQTVLDLSNEKGVIVSLTKAIKYINCVAVKSGKAFLYKSSDDKSITKMYLVKGDLISIIKTYGNWILIEYRGKKRITSWMKIKDISHLLSGHSPVD